MRTDYGTDATASACFDPSGTGTGLGAPATYIGLSSSNVAPVHGDTTMVGEITTGTLARGQGIYTHTLGTNLATLAKTFTADQSITVYKIGLFQNSSGGSPCWEALLTAPSIFNAVGDQAQFTYAINL